MERIKRQIVTMTDRNAVSLVLADGTRVQVRLAKNGPVNALLGFIAPRRVPVFRFEQIEARRMAPGPHSEAYLKSLRRAQ